MSVKFAGNINIAGKVIISKSSPPPPPIDWGALPQGAGGFYENRTQGIGVAGDVILLSGSTDSNLLRPMVSTDGGYTFVLASGVPTNSFATPVARVNAHLGWYMFSDKINVYLSTTSPTSGYVVEYNLPMNGTAVASSQLLDDGRICFATSVSQLVYKKPVSEGGGWEIKPTIPGATGISGITHVANDEWVIVADDGKAYYSDDNLSTTTLLESYLNSGSTTGDMRAVASHSSGLVIATTARGDMSYSINFGKVGTWLPITAPSAGYALDISQDGLYVVISGGAGGGLAYIASTLDLSTWEQLLPVGLNGGGGSSYIFWSAAFSPEGKCIIGTNGGGYVAISPPL